MILKTYQKEINKTDEEKQLEKEYIIYQEMDYNRLTDKQLNEKYNKNYLLKMRWYKWKFAVDTNQKITLMMI